MVFNVIFELFTYVCFCYIFLEWSTMLTIIIRYFFILISFFYICTKLYYKSINKKKSLLFLVPILSILLITSCLTNSNTLSRMIIALSICYLSVTIILNFKPLYSFFIISISFVLSLVFYILSNTLTCILYISYYGTESSLPYLSAAIASGFIQLIFVYFSLLSKRFQNGLRLLIVQKKIVFGSIASVFFIMGIIILSIYRSHILSTKIIIIISLIFLATFFLYYWQHRITQTYREELRIVNEKSLEDEITSLKEEITSLKADNHRLTQIVHKDNKLVPAMETTVLEFLQSAKVLSTEELFTRGSELSRTLQEMAKERIGILTSLSSTNNSMPSSGLIAIDGLLSYMEKRAAESNINYKVKMDDNIKELILTALNEDDLRHLLGDLIENAIIATNYSELPKHISIHLGSLQDKFLLEISDSGIPFNPETYQYFGYEHCSTHQEDGGTGTGLLDIWSIKKKYKASLYIYEYESSLNVYTKKISFLFDGKNHFLLKTYRDKEIKNSLIRGDLHVFPHEAE